MADLKQYLEKIEVPEDSLLAEHVKRHPELAELARIAYVVASYPDMEFEWLEQPDGAQARFVDMSEEDGAVRIEPALFGKPLPPEVTTHWQEVRNLAAVSIPVAQATSVDQEIDMDL